MKFKGTTLVVSSNCTTPVPRSMRTCQLVQILLRVEVRGYGTTIKWLSFLLVQWHSSVSV